MAGHSIIYHDEGGKLTFGFHATKFATINSTHPPVNITGERRIAAGKLKGHSRKENIQPDYTVWTLDTDRCVLAIEAKHYKRGSYRNFRDALDDYASNLPDARVFLGNYGPIQIVLEMDTRDGGESRRQFAWGNLNPEFPQVLASFRSAIRNIFGDPDQSRVRYQSKSCPACWDSMFLHQCTRLLEMKRCKRRSLRLSRHLRLRISLPSTIIFCSSSQQTWKESRFLSASPRPQGPS